MIWFCTKAGGLVNDAPAAEGSKKAEDRETEIHKKLAADVKAGKIEVTKTKAEIAAEKAAAANQPKGKKAKRVRDGPSVFYDDDNSIQMDYPIIQKFSKLGLAPPMDTEGMSSKNDEIIKLREALKLAGKIERTVRKSELLKDKTLVETEEHLELKKEYETVDYETKKKVEKIKHETMFGTELTIGTGEYEDDRERSRDRRPGNRYTALRPNTTRGPRDGRSRDRNDRNDRQRAQSNRRRDDGDAPRDAANTRQRQRNNKPVFDQDGFPSL